MLGIAKKQFFGRCDSITKTSASQIVFIRLDLLGIAVHNEFQTALREISKLILISVAVN